MPLRYYGHEDLSKNCFEYKIITDDGNIGALKATVDNMYSTMGSRGGIGLAANQIGMPYPIFVWRVGDSEGVAINPKLEVSDSGQGTVITHMEGCLSSPGYHVPVQRATKCKLTATNLQGEEFVIEAEGLLSTVFQHEMDHLWGYSIIDQLNREQRRAVKKDMAKRSS